MDSFVITSIELCAGVGMLGEGLAAGLRHMGVDSRCVLYAEREAYPCAVLEARMEEGSLAPAPIWFGDFTELDGRQFRGVVDCVVAGFPCQDLSVAGKRDGLGGSRSGLFFEVARIATDSGAWLLALENVSGIATATASVVDEEEGELEERAAARVVGELADLGWDSEWITLAASEVGAAHRRERWFCLAWRVADSERGPGGIGRIGLQWKEAAGEPCERNENELADSSRHGLERGSKLDCREIKAEQRTPHRDDAERCDPALADARRRPVRGDEPQPVGRCGYSACADLCGCGLANPIATGWRPEASADKAGLACVAEKGSARCCECGRNALGRSELICQCLANSIGTRSQIRAGGGSHFEALQSSEWLDAARVHPALDLFAPGPADPRWAGILAELPGLAPALTADEAAQCRVRGLADGMAIELDDSRAARLRSVGNGVVPLQAAVAFVTLASRAGLFQQRAVLKAEA